MNFYEGEVGWCGQGMNRVVCLQDYSRTSPCEHFRPTWALSHTFRYNTHKAVLFSLHFSEQVHKNLRAAMPAPHSQHHGENTVIILNPLLVQTRQLTMNSAGELLPTFTKARKHTGHILLFLHLEYKRHTANNTAKSSTNALTACTGNKVGLRMRDRRDTCCTQAAPLIHKTGFLTSTRSLGTSKIYDQWQVLGTACECLSM